MTRDEVLRQHREAGLETRRRRARLRKELQAMDRDAAWARLVEILREDPVPHEIANVEPYDVLQWPRRAGHKTAHAAIQRAGLRSHKPLGELLPSQRKALADALEGLA